MDAGRLRHRVTIQAQASAAADAYGEQLAVWSDIATVSAEVKTLDGSEAWRVKQSQPEATVNVLMRYNSDMKADCRIVFDGRYLYPLSVVPDIKKRELRILCREQLT